MRSFDVLDTFARSKRSPIGYEPFVRHLVEAGHPREAAAYVVRCDAPKRVDLYVFCGDWRAAGKECRERGDKKTLEYVFSFFYGRFRVFDIDGRGLKRRCPNNVIARELEMLASSMK